jgi:dTDP-L-rhamnose 4-epimerase
MAAALAAEFGGGLVPEITGDFRLGDVRHIVASPAAAEQGLHFRAAIGFREGIGEFAKAPLREPARAAGALM